MIQFTKKRVISNKYHLHLRGKSLIITTYDFCPVVFPLVSDIKEDITFEQIIIWKSNFTFNNVKVRFKETR